MSITLFGILLTWMFYIQVTFASGFDHSLYDILLKKNVFDGMVNYRNIKNNDIALLERYLQKVETLDPAAFDSWSREEKMVFWINVYNAITIYGIVKNYPIQYGGFVSRLRFPKSSIRQMKNFWDTVFIPVMGNNISLDQIEHAILRKKFGDPRIHFTLVCASQGCPRLRAEAYIPEKFQEQLEQETRQFISSEDYISLDTKKNILFISSIFTWYAKDFPYDGTKHWIKKYRKNERGIVQFIVSYLDSGRAEYIKKNNPRIEHKEYDWSLNESK